MRSTSPCVACRVLPSSSARPAAGRNSCSPSPAGEFRDPHRTCEGCAPMDETITETSADAPRPPEGSGDAGSGDDERRADDPVAAGCCPSCSRRSSCSSCSSSRGRSTPAPAASPATSSWPGPTSATCPRPSWPPRSTTLAERFADTPVEIVAGDDTLHHDRRRHRACMVDEDRTVERTLDVGSDTFALLRPFAWVGSFLSEREAPLVFQVSDDQVATATVELEGEDRILATEPTVELVDGVVPRRARQGRHGHRPRRRRRRAARRRPRPAATATTRSASSSSACPSRRSATTPPPSRPRPAPRPSWTRRSRSRPAAATAPSPSDELRSWVTLSTAPDGTVAVDLDPGKVNPALRDPLRRTSTAARSTPASPSRAASRSSSRSRPARSAAATTPRPASSPPCAAAPAPLSSTSSTRQPTFTAAEAAKLGIVEEVGHPDVFGPTTKHACCESRVQNIHRIADLIRGVVILPGESFSVNAHVGKRTVAKGFTTGGAIIDGRVGTGIGGGISQFATTFFNASLYAGPRLRRVPEPLALHQPLPAGPRGDALVPAPRPDHQEHHALRRARVADLHRHHDHGAPVLDEERGRRRSGEPTASPAGNCTKYTTPRTRTYADGRVDHDTVFARYRPAEGVNC